MASINFLKSWSSTHKFITLSSAEAELVAAVKMSTEIIGMTQLADDRGIACRGRVHVDPNAAIRIAHRCGNGKLRHVHVGNLWIQERVEEGDLKLEKIGGTWNPADALTKGLDGNNLMGFMEMCNQRVTVGRAESTLKLNTLRLV